MKKAKKLIAIALAFIFVLSCFAVPVSAGTRKPLSVSAGISALRNQFEDGAGPLEGGHSLDYCYYSPVGSRDKEKYPLVIFLHGIGHGDYVGSQLDDSDFPYWSSSELQSRFAEGGAFILLPRAPEDKLVYWSSSLVESLRALIDDFVEIHGDNIDTSKIFIGGSSAGGEMTWDMITAFPDYFAGAFPIAATGTVTSSDTKKCSSVAIWMFASKLDPVVSYVATTTPLWNNVKENNDHPELCRLSAFSSVVEPSGNSASDNHHLAKVVTYDMHMLDGSTYPSVTTKDGNGNTLTLKSPNGMIYWMNSVSSDYDGENGSGTGGINVSFITDIVNVVRNFFLKIVNIFQRIFGL